MQYRSFGWLLVAVAATSFWAPNAMAQQDGDRFLRVGVGTVDPKSDNGDIASVDSGTTLVFNGTWFVADNIGIELLASLPFSHDVKLAADGTKVGETKHLPPTLSVQYYFETAGAFDPYVGLGVNYTLFFDEETTGPLSGLDLSLDDSLGVAAQIGFDYQFTESMFMNVDARWINIETDAKLDGVALETVEIDPLVYSLTVGWKF